MTVPLPSFERYALPLARIAQHASYPPAMSTRPLASGIVPAS